MSNTLILIARRRGMNGIIADKNAKMALEVRSYSEHKGNAVDLVIDERPVDDSSFKHLDGLAYFNARCRHAMPHLRQSIIDDYLGEHDYVLWIDADVIVSPVDVLEKLIELSKSLGGAIVAPKVMSMKDPYWFYDTGGFIEDRGGKHGWASNMPPYFEGRRLEQELVSVGAFYLVPSDVYRSGGRHKWLCDNTTDHYSICRHASDMGRKVVCDMKMSVWHADLSKYEGEKDH